MPAPTRRLPPLLLLAPLLLAACVASRRAPVEAAPPKPAAAPTMASVLAASSPSDWRPLDPENTLYVELAAGRVVIELAPAFAPRHAANIRALVREGYFDGLAFLRAQDGYVVQLGDPAEDGDAQRPIRTAQRTLAAEFTRTAGGDLPFTPLPDADGWSPEAGFSGGFPAARDVERGQAWLVHCYGMVGAARAVEADSGSGSSLYVVIGHAPRQLDRNITLVGRVVQGMDLLSVLPRGSGALGFYERPEQLVPIRALRVAADVAEADRARLEVLRTDTPTFAALVESRRNRREEWFKAPAGHVDVCSVPMVVRPVPGSAGSK